MPRIPIKQQESTIQQSKAYQRSKNEMFPKGFGFNDV
jgi:hypothetical protein